jgi:tryptophan halogenase
MTAGADTPPGAVRSVIVVGGGTAGYFTALALQAERPDLDVTVLESSSIPIIGVGEATTTLMPPFLHRQLGIDIVELYRQVQPTWKLGINFEWGGSGTYRFQYPFGAISPLEAYAQEGHIGNQSITALLMAADRAPFVRHDDGQPLSLLPQVKFAYHLDNKPFVAYLAGLARRRGLRHIDAKIERVEVTADGGSVDRLVLDDGRELRADLYVDATGFRSLLLEQALGSPFISYASSLFCDRAVVAEVPQRGPIQPYTTAETMNAGWCWRIPVEGEDHRGYVHSSAHLGEDEAREEMRAKNPGMGDTWTVRFRSGRHREFWRGNTVAVGNAYGFVEPLQSTALHMVIVEIAYLLGGLESRGEPDREFANARVGEHWDFLRWFLSLHYRFNRRLDTPFWRDCRAEVDISGLARVVERFTTEGPWDTDLEARHATGDPAFAFMGIMVMLLGQQVPCPPPPAPVLTRAQWEARVAECRALVERSLPQADALALLRQRPELLMRAVSASNSWINTGGELLRPASPTGPNIHPQDDVSDGSVFYRDHLFRGIVRAQPGPG